MGILPPGEAKEAEADTKSTNLGSMVWWDISRNLWYLWVCTPNDKRAYYIVLYTIWQYVLYIFAYCNQLDMGEGSLRRDLGGTTTRVLS